MTMTKLKPTDVPEKVIAWYAKILGIDTVDVIDRLEIRGDNILLSLHGLPDGEDVPWAWIWSRGDEDNFELDE
jgi:hypothetical protein